MNGRIQELLAHLEHHRAVLHDAFEAVPTELRSQRPAPDRWSAAEVVEHLSIVDGRFTQIFAQRVAEARANGLRIDRESSSMVDSVDVSRLLNRSERIQAHERAQPGGLEQDTVWERAQAIREALIAAVMTADGLALQDVSHVHTVLGKLNMYQWLATMGWHEARHTAQVREIAEAFRSAALVDGPA